MAAPLDVSPVEATAASEAVLAGGGQIEGRSLGQIAWRRLRRDKVAMAGGVVVVLLVLSAVFTPACTKYYDIAPHQAEQDREPAHRGNPHARSRPHASLR